MTCEGSSRASDPRRAHSRLGRIGLTAVALAAGLCSGACELDDLDLTLAAPSTTSGYVVGVALDHGEGALYVCGTTDATRADSAWFRVDGARRVVDTHGVERGSITIGDHVTGTISIGGQEVPFDLDARADVGLVLDGFDSGCRTGVVTFRGDDGLETAGTWCSASGQVEQVTPITPIQDAAAGLWVRIGVEPNRELLVRPVRATLR
ncbi:MAG: hypothetical protein U0414_18750 [Polyangiaceae bacterium]